MTFIEENLGALLGNTVVTPSEGLAQERAAVARIRNGLTASAAVNLVAFAHGDSPDGVHAHIEAAGSAEIIEWPEVNEALSRRLAAAAMIDLYEEDIGDAAVAAALASLTAALLGRGTMVPALQSRAGGASARLADARRDASVNPWSVQPFPPSKSPELPPDDATPVLMSHLRAYMNTDRVQVRNAATNAHARLWTLERLAQRNSEEIDLLWWSLAPESSFVDGWAASGEAATLVSALEVGRRMLVQPPARGVSLLLEKALEAAGNRPDDRVTLESAVAAAPQLAIFSDGLTGQTPAWGTPVMATIAARRSGDAPASEANRSATKVEWALQLVREMSLSSLSEGPQT